MKKSDPLWKRADHLWSECVKTKAGGICQFCKQRAGSGSHHIVPRGYTATAFLVENGVWLCSVCHNDDIDLDSRGLFLIGQVEYLRLWGIANKGAQLREHHLLEIVKKLKAELRYLKEIEKESRI